MGIGPFSRTPWLAVILAAGLAQASPVEAGNFLRCTWDRLIRKSIAPEVDLSGAPEFLRNPDLKSREWRSMFVRDASAPLSDSYYLENVTHALQDRFDPWFRGGSPVSEMSYQDMLLAQQSEIIQGRNGRSVYRPPTSRGTRQAPEPGVFRDDPKRMVEGKIPEAYVIISESALARYTSASEYPELTALQSKFMERLKENPKALLRPEIKGIPKEVLPHASRGEMRDFMDQSGLAGRRFEIARFYAEPKDLPIYLKRLEELMDRLRSPSLSQGELLNALADYHQTFIVALPFIYGNNSLAMSQINYILMSRGLKGISHGGLDFMAVLTSTEEYRTIFKAAVRAKNPGL